MKQSTTFAQVATNLLNVLQGYTKGIRFVVVLTMLLTVTTNMSSATYTKVTTAPSDWSGEYLIVYETGNVAFNGALTTLDAVSNTISVKISDGTITTTDADATFTITKSGTSYTIQSKSGYYIGQASNANGLTSSENTLNNTISINNDKTVNIVSSGGAYLRYNAASNQNRFRYYKSSSYTGQKAICLYKLKEETNYSVTSNLSNVTSALTNPTTVLESAEELNLAYAAKNGWNLPDAISVTMGGNALSLNDEYTWDKENGKVWIVPDNGFTGNIVVTINGWQQLTPPNGLNVSNITSSSATLSWTKDSNAKSYTINILGENDPEAEPVLVIEDITTNSYTLIGLEAETEYLIGLVAVGDGTTYTDSQQECFDVFETLQAGYTITYNTDGGDAIPAASGTALPDPLPTPTKDNYEFQGWYTNEACTQAATAGTTINADITLYAKWEAVTYTITLVPNYPNSQTGVFKDNGGNTIAGNLLIPIKYGTTSQPLTDFYSELSLDGYQFDAFYTQREGGQKRVNTGTLTKDLTLYARWKKEYTVTWNVNGKNTGTTIIVEGKEWTLPEVDESCNGKQFVGWTTTEIPEEQDEAPATLYTETNQFPLETNTYYAVFANVEVTGTGKYVKLTEALTDYSGEYLIVYEAGSLAFDGGQDKENLEDGVSVAVTIENNTIEATTEIDAARFTIASIIGGYYVKSASGYYIGCTANDKGLYASQNEQYLNDITWGGTMGKR